MVKQMRQLGLLIKKYSLCEIFLHKRNVMIYFRVLVNMVSVMFLEAQILLIVSVMKASCNDSHLELDALIVL